MPIKLDTTYLDSSWKRILIWILAEKEYLSYGFNTLGPLCLWQCFPILATRWRYLNWLQIWPTGGGSCISCKLGHQVAQLTLVIRWRHLHCFQSWSPGRVAWIALLAIIHSKSWSSWSTNSADKFEIFCRMIVWERENYQSQYPTTNNSVMCHK